MPIIDHYHHEGNGQTSLYSRVLMTRDAGLLTRFHGFHTNRPYTLAEHCYGMIQLWYAVKPHDAPPELTEAVVAWILKHDVPELFTGDVPAPAKARNAALDVCLSKYERWIFSLFYPVDEPPSEYVKTTVHALDWMDLYMWALEDYARGNRYLGCIISRLRKNVPLCVYSSESDPLWTLFMEIETDGWHGVFPSEEFGVFEL